MGKDWNGFEYNTQDGIYTFNFFAAFTPRSRNTKKISTRIMCHTPMRFTAKNLYQSYVQSRNRKRKEISSLLCLVSSCSLLKVF